MKQFLNKEEVDSIDDAIKALERASNESKKHLKEMMGEDYKAVKKTFDSIAPKIERAKKDFSEKSQRFIENTKNKAVEQSSKTVSAIDNKAHDKPWQLAAGALLFGGILGFSLRGSASAKKDVEKNMLH